MLFILTCFFSECSDFRQKSGGSVVKREFYPDGKLRTEQEFVNDTIAEGYFRKYYPNGKTEIELNFRNNVEDGKEISYYENGTIQSIVNYTEGIKTGPAEWRYENGALETKVRYFKGKVTGEAYDYYRNGKLRRYFCLDFDEHVRFEIKYDEGGNVLSRQGEGLIYASADEFTLSIGDTLKIFVLMATPPDCQYRIELTPDVKSAERITVPIDEENSVCEYETIVIKEGKFKFAGTIYLKYPDGEESNETFAGEYEVVKLTQ